MTLESWDLTRKCEQEVRVHCLNTFCNQKPKAFLLKIIKLKLTNQTKTKTSWNELFPFFDDSSVNQWIWGIGKYFLKLHYSSFNEKRRSEKIETCYRKYWTLKIEVLYRQRREAKKWKTLTALLLSIMELKILNFYECNFKLNCDIFDLLTLCTLKASM